MSTGSPCTWRRRFWLGPILGLLWLPALFAAAAPQEGMDYHRSTWTQRDGAPPDIWALTQDRSGPLWLGTGVGLYQFDGLRFERYNPPQGQGFASSNITALLSDRRGRLWIGFYPGGISTLDQGTLRHYPPSPHLPSGLVMRIVEDRAGHIWVASFTGLYRFDGQDWRRIGADTGFPYAYADDVMLDSQGTLWVTAGNTLMNLPPGGARFVPTGIATGLYTSLLETPGGALWVSDGAHGTRSLSLAAPDAPQMPGFGHFASMRLDRQGALWGTDRRRGGVVRVARLDAFARGHALREQDASAIIRERNGLASDRAIPLLADREGNIWVGTNMGLHRFRPSSVQGLQDERLSQDGVYGMAFSATHGLLVSSERQLYRVDGKTLTWLAESPGKRIYAVQAVGPHVYLATWQTVYRYTPAGLRDLDVPGTGPLGAVTGDGAAGLLVMREGDGLYHYDGTAWRRVGAGLIPARGATSLLRDTDGSVWIGYTGSRLVHWRNGALRAFDGGDGLDIGTVSSLARVAVGLLAGGENGVALLRDGQVHALQANDRTRLNGITGIHAGRGGGVWLSGVNGVLQVPADVLARAPRSGHLDGRLYDTADGMPGIAQQSALASTIVADGTGRLWFTTNQGLAMIDPARRHYNPVVPTASIRGLAAGSVDYAPQDGRAFAPGTRDIQIRYGTSSLAYPEHVRFRYRLEGFDEAWQQAGNRRVAYYTSLAPGDYRFQVQAANESGVWSPQSATLAFSVAPHFVQTWWFVAVCGLSLAAAVYAAWQWRLRRVSQRMRMRFEERHRERERIARELHDTLLQSFQGLLLRFQAAASGLSGDDPVRVALEQAMDRGEEAIVEGRERVHSLRIAEASVQEALPAAFMRLGRELAQVHPAVFEVTADSRLPPLDPVVRDEVYWIGREALCNAFRHAQARRIEVEIRAVGGKVVFRFRDDGRGIAEEVRRRGARAGHWGLCGMRERAADIGAELRITSTPGQGTQVELAIARGARVRARRRGQARDRDVPA
ncbi:sensor histidine kinase [Pseudoxanthomonas sp. Root65]|uniref:sensor histidine kinase n=1 Tax=Pseudoxanthomonas sp. Root65 TaxID=1736576 RepID=UPI000AA850AD|nr:sensor histidine kinase [Pseudoxanthomonas sp. Root65]